MQNKKFSLQEMGLWPRVPQCSRKHKLNRLSWQLLLKQYTRSLCHCHLLKMSRTRKVTAVVLRVCIVLSTFYAY